MRVLEVADQNTPHLLMLSAGLDIPTLHAMLLVSILGDNISAFH